MSLLAWAPAAALSVAAILVLLPPADAGPRRPVPRTFTLRRAAGSLLRMRKAVAEPQPEETAALLRQYAALLQSGRSEAQAWADLAAHWRRTAPEHPLSSVCSTVAASLHTGLGAAEGLRRAASHCDAVALRTLLHRLAGVARLSERTGAPLSRLVEQLARSAEDRAELSAQMRTAVAGPKLTQQILTLLPIGGVMLGQIMGASPLAALLGGGWGTLCLTAGLALLAAGGFWSARMIAAVGDE